MPRMIAIAPVVFAVMLPAQQADRGKELDRVAQVGTAMVDGDVCKRIQTERSARMLLEKDPRDPWKASDNFDVNDQPFIQTKKTLMRLARLCPAACDVNLWMPVPADPPRIQILVRNVNEMSQFWRWGDLHSEMPAEMKRVLDTGERVAVRKRPGMISVLAPVYDSLGNIAGLIEVVSRDHADPRENVK
ncbi:MAG: hypothetical protein U0Q18_34440 [Bryobacteraceae bacterium]